MQGWSHSSSATAGISGSPISSAWTRTRWPRAGANYSNKTGIAERHPDLLPEHRERVAEVLADPDQIRRSVRFGRARLFSRWYTDLQRGRHVVVVVVSPDFSSRKRASEGRRQIISGIGPGEWRMTDNSLLRESKSLIGRMLCGAVWLLCQVS